MSEGPSDRVRRLDGETVERIAAGEVVTRPARVVAELVENALDAGASRVDVEVEGDGTELIRVADDGRGMAREDAALAVERHTTSKLAGRADLARVETLGFRGEALASVAETATLDLQTSDGGAVGTRVLVAEGETTVSDAGRARGTTVRVRELFYNRPARREALAGPATEFARISELMADYALARPEVRFSLSHDGSETFATAGGGPTDALLGVYDRSTASRSRTFAHESAVELDGRERPLTATGALCYPSVTRATGDHMCVAVNGRPVRNAELRRAVEAGYGSLVPGGRHPVAAVDVRVPPELVDANVHPAKTEVTLRRAAAVADAVEAGVSDALSTADLRRRAEAATDLETALDRPGADDGGRLSPFADATVVGRFRGLYLLCESGTELLVVDQHAAHERVNYERLRTAFDGEGVPTAPLDPPETLSLASTAAATAAANADLLGSLGFDVEPFGGDLVRLRGVPAPLGRTADVDALRDLLDALASGERPSDPRDALSKDLACHPSLKAGDELTDAGARELLDRLGECERPYACPHGRPTVLALDEKTFARGFERGNVRFD